MAPPAKKTKPHAPLKSDNLFQRGFKGGVNMLGGLIGGIGYRGLQTIINPIEQGINDRKTYVNASAASVAGNAKKAMRAAKKNSTEYNEAVSMQRFVGDDFNNNAGHSIPYIAAATPYRLVEGTINAALTPLSLLSDGANFIIDKLSGTTEADNYGKGMSIQQRQANRQAIGLLAGQYLALMTPEKVPSSWLTNKSVVQDVKERNNFRQQLFASVSRNINYLPLRQDPTDLTKPPMSPIDTYMEAMVYATEGKGPDVHPLPTKTEGPIHPGLEKARNAIREQQKQAATDGKADATAKKFQDSFNAKLQALQDAIRDGKSIDPRANALYLHKLRYESVLQMSQIAKLQAAERTKASDALFDAAIAIQQNDTAAIDSMSPDLKARAQEMLTGLEESGAFDAPPPEDVTKIEGDTDDTLVSGEKSTPTTPPAKPDPVEVLKQKKAEESSRINDAANKSAEKAKQELSSMAEDYYVSMSRQINASARLARLSRDQRLKAQDIIEASSESKSEVTLSDSNLEQPIDSVKVVDELMKQQGYLEGGNGKATWRIETDGKGNYSVKLNGSHQYQQEAINDQAALIALKHDSIHFKAKHTTRSPGGGYKLDELKTKQIAIKQAIAIMTTTGLDPEKSTIEVPTSVDPKTGEALGSRKMTAKEVLTEFDAQIMTSQRHSAYKNPKTHLLPFRGGRKESLYDALLRERQQSDKAVHDIITRPAGEERSKLDPSPRPSTSTTRAFQAIKKTVAEGVKAKGVATDAEIKAEIEQQQSASATGSMTK